MTWNDGSVYEGEFDRGTRHGRGELRLSDGFIYSGSWDTNYMEGRGMSIFPDGQEYQGMFKKGLRDGRGSITFAEVYFSSMSCSFSFLGRCLRGEVP